MASKIRRWLRELAVWLLIGAAVSLGGGLFSPARAAAKRQRHIAADTRRQDAGSACHEPAKAAAAVRLGDWCGVCRYTTPSVASLAADSGNVLTVALRSGDNVTLEKWLTEEETGAADGE